MLNEILHWLKQALRRLVSIMRSSSLEHLDKCLSGKGKRRTSLFSAATAPIMVSAISPFNKDEFGKKLRHSADSGSRGFDRGFSRGSNGSSLGQPMFNSAPASRFGSSTPSGRRDSLAVCLTEDVEYEMQTVSINVGGRVFVVSKESLSRYPSTMLGSLTAYSPSYNRTKREYYFDRNPSLFDSILDLYRANELHIPRNVCGKAALKELEFWGIPAIWVAPCCWGSLHEAIEEERLLKDLRGESGEHKMTIPMGKLKTKLWSLLYEHKRRTRSREAWDVLMGVLMALSIMLFFADSLTEIDPMAYFRTYLDPNITQPGPVPPPRRNTFVVVSEWIMLVILIMEFSFKVVLCPDLKSFWKNALNVVYTLSLLGSLTGNIAELVMETKEYWVEEDSLEAVYLFKQCAHWLRIVRLLELMDWGSSLYVMWVATMKCGQELLLLLIVFIIQALIFGAFAFFVEKAYHKQLGGHSNHRAASTAGTGKKGGGPFAQDLANSLYWAIITMTTVGYGDITPSSPFGRVVGALCSLSGVIVLALPVAILTDSFQQYHLRQKIRKEQGKREKDFLRQSHLPFNSVAATERVSL